MMGKSDQMLVIWRQLEKELVWAGIFHVILCVEEEELRGKELVWAEYSM
jgi:hypothetical protein